MSAHIINGYDLGTYGDLDVCTEVFAVHDGEFPAEQPRQDSEAYARAFLLKLLSRPCTPLEGSPDESIAFADDETGLGFVVAYETGEESAYGTVEVSDVRVVRHSAYDRGNSACRDDDVPPSFADWREKVLTALAAVDVSEMDGDSHVWLSAICAAVHQPVLGWTRGACAMLRSDLISLIGASTGDDASTMVIAQLQRRLDRKQRRVDALCKQVAELERKLEHRQALAERNGCDARDANRENKSLRHQIKAYEQTVQGLVELVNLRQGK